MTAMLVLWIVIGCAVSVACDWAFYGRMAMLLRQIEMPDQFTYGRSLLIRKIAIGIIGGLLAFSAVRDDGKLTAVAIGLWVTLHLAIYVEWYRFARGASARSA